jgi:hypothetical protein
VKTSHLALIFKIYQKRKNMLRKTYRKMFVISITGQPRGRRGWGVVKGKRAFRTKQNIHVVPHSNSLSPTNIKSPFSTLPTSLSHTH